MIHQEKRTFRFSADFLDFVRIFWIFWIFWIENPEIQTVDSKSRVGAYLDYNLLQETSPGFLIHRKQLKIHEKSKNPQKI